MSFLDTYDDEENTREFFEILLLFLMRNYNYNTAVFISEQYFKVLMDAIQNNNYSELERINGLIKSNPDKAILAIKNVSSKIPNDYLSDPTFATYRGWMLELMGNLKDNSDEENRKYLNDRLQDIVSSIMSYSYLQDAISNGFTHKKWETMMDNRVRPAHAQINGSVIPIQEPFVNLAGSILFPHDPNATMANTANCRCTLVFIRGDDE